LFTRPLPRITENTPPETGGFLVGDIIKIEIAVEGIKEF
jgi:hypothetical protein